MQISLVDDERILASKIQKRLEGEGYMVNTFTKYTDFMQAGDASSDIYIVDISLPDGSGFDIIRWLRGGAVSKAPILIISGYGDSEKIVYGLSIGADDYMVKPLVPDELVARIKALMRRPVHVDPGTPLSHRDIVYFPERNLTTVGGTPIPLTHKESMILELFLRHPNRIIRRDELISSIWGGHKLSDVSDNTINVTLAKVRKKIGPSFRLKTIYSEGYILE